MDKEELYRTFYPKVFGYVGARLNNRTETEDVVSDIFVKVYAALDSYDESKASLSTWIYTITKNTLINYYGKRSNAPLPLEDYAESPEVQTPDLDPMLDALGEALGTLDGTRRDIVMLHYYYGLSHQEIADKMGLSYANVRKLASLAVAELRTKLS